MTPLTSLSPALIDEIVLIDVVALFLSVGTVVALWRFIKKIFPNDVREVGTFLTFIVVIVPFVMLVWFGLAVLNYDAIIRWTGLPSALPLPDLSPLLIGIVTFYIGQTLWLWRDWRKL